LSFDVSFESGSSLKQHVLRVERNRVTMRETRKEEREREREGGREGGREGDHGDGDGDGGWSSVGKSSQVKSSSYSPHKYKIAPL
jgi:hypothetical protein